MTFPRKILIAMSLILLIGACANEKSLTAADEDLNGVISIKVTNTETGESVVVPYALPASASQKEIAAAMDQIREELGWSSVRFLRPMLIDGPAARPCGPYTGGDCKGTNPNCQCD